MFAARLATASRSASFRSLNTSTSSGSGRKNVIGIRREDKNRWERRVALTPELVKELIAETGTSVIVQPSSNRIFNDDAYAAAGAIIKEDLTDADVILGIKEVPASKLIPDKTYIMFSHTHKGQRYNLPLLQTFLNKRNRIIDYELMTDEQSGSRLVLFGRHAGFAGMIDGFHGLGQRMLGMGYGTPFLNIGMTYTYRTLADAKNAVAIAGQAIAAEGLPRDFNPVTFVFTGNGNVSQGAQEVFKHLPHEYVSPADLKYIATDKSVSNKKVYAAEVTDEDYAVRKDDMKSFDRAEYRAKPELYTSVFHDKIAPHTTMLINGIFWDDKFPRLLTTEQLRAIQANPELKNRMLTISDISCDYNGSLEFMDHASTMDKPFFYMDAINGKQHLDVEGKGVQIMSIDNLPTELPLESSQHFSSSLRPFIKEIVNNNFDHTVVRRAIITENGKLKPQHEHLTELLASHKKGADAAATAASSTVSTGKRVLLLGSGMVARPLVEYLLRRPEVNITIASAATGEAEALAAGRKNASVVHLDVSSESAVADLVSKHDVVVSFVPAPLHPIVAEACIANKKHMVTASYISPAMKDLDAKAKDAGIVIMNEIGLDPGIDHLTAMSIIDEVKRDGGRIKSFISWCGGLPAPEDSANPLGYKFSWSPRGVLTAAMNNAQFKMRGRIHDIPGTQLLAQHFASVPIYNGFALEGLANRDSLPYASLYGLDLDSMDTMFRGTLRFKGFSDLMHAYLRLGLLDTDPATGGKFESWAQFVDAAIFTAPKDSAKVTKADRMGAIAAKLRLPAAHPMVDRTYQSLQWLGAIDSPLAAAPLAAASALDGLCEILRIKLAYAPKERDLVVLHHEFGVELGNGSTETRTSTLVAYGDSVTGTTAMATTVGVPAAIATEMILDGQIAQRGVIAPMHKDVYAPILSKLTKEGLVIKEAATPGLTHGMASTLSWNGSGIWA
ncbi:hypothetical protein GQ42DRAFT_174340 [Ramicandelaber brevisporus]|nr:hypothetical protein GQ42DRAFT_174340 [Ramicandelaber brevisporus]